MGQDRRGLHPAMREQYIHQPASLLGDFSLRQQIEIIQRRPAFQHLLDLDVALRIAVRPQLERSGADEGFRMREALGRRRPPAENLVGLPEVAFRTDFVQLRLHLQQHGDHYQRIAGDQQRGTIAE